MHFTKLHSASPVLKDGDKHSSRQVVGTLRTTQQELGPTFINMHVFPEHWTLVRLNRLCNHPAGVLTVREKNRLEFAF